MSLRDLISPLHHRWQEQQPLLYVRRKMQQIENLRESRRRHTGDLRKLSLASHFTSLQHPIESNRQRHQPRNSWNATAPVLRRVST
jgi:hypothetical protein